MLRATRRRIGSSAWLVLGMIVGLPALAEAQLFPNRTIKRQRENCAAEPPFNAHVRRDYFGYYPTCWSRFPEGWQCPCPNPELPDLARSLRDFPRSKPPEAVPADGAGPGPADDRGRVAPDTDPAPAEGEMAPPLPEGRQPFRIEGRPTPAPTGPTTPSTPDPSLPPKGARLSPPTSTDPATSVGLLEMPSLPSPSQVTQTSNIEPGAMMLAPDVTQVSAPAPAVRDLGPLPAAGSTVASDSEIMLGGPAPAAGPAQAPQRKGLLGGLFNPSNRRRR